MSRPLVGFGSTMTGGDVALRRKILRKAFKSDDVKYNNVKVFKSLAGPFRAAMNNADPLGRINQSCGGCNQVHDVNIRIHLRQDGVGNQSCDVSTLGFTPRQIPLESGNCKYVHDSSLFTRFKNLSSLNKNYNDTSFGGNDHNGAYVSLMAVRR